LYFVKIFTFKKYLFKYRSPEKSDRIFRNFLGHILLDSVKVILFHNRAFVVSAASYINLL